MQSFFYQSQDRLSRTYFHTCHQETKRQKSMLNKGTEDNLRARFQRSRIQRSYLIEHKGYTNSLRAVMAQQTSNRAEDKFKLPVRPNKIEGTIATSVPLPQFAVS